jgi:hypothetical protein
MRRLLAAACLLLCAAAPPPVREIAPGRVAVRGAEMPVYLSQDWQAPLPGVTRAVLVMHGVNRDADTYFSGLRAAASRAGAGAETLLIAPQVLAEEDIAAHHPAGSLLHWDYGAWAGGLPARGPVPASPFDGFDAILARLADRRLFPALAEVVVAGHSAGGQVVHRYAVVGRGDAALAAVGVRTRYVVANPSSYVYFTPERPSPGGGFALPPAGACPGYDDWRYGLAGNLPPYLTDAPATLQARYLARDVTYLLGTRDTNPNHRVLDKSCAAELQGPYRYARGHSYLDHLRSLHAAMKLQRLWDVPGVAHDGPGMINSPCGLAALFGAHSGACPTD